MDKKVYDVHFLNNDEDYYASFSTKERAKECIEKFNNLALSEGMPERLDTILMVRDIDTHNTEGLKIVYGLGISRDKGTAEISLTPCITDKIYEKNFSTANDYKVFLSQDRLKVLNEAIIWCKDEGINKDSLRFMCEAKYSASILCNSDSVKRYVEDNWDK